MNYSRSWLGVTALIATCSLVGCGTRPAKPVAASAIAPPNPYAPWRRHAYRHGAVPTREAAQKMRAWEASMRVRGAPAVSPTILAFGGGIDGIGVTSGTPRVYLVFYGSQWQGGGGGDPEGAAQYLQNLFAGIGTGGETWSGTMTQYCDGPTVPKGATTCDPATTPHVRYPNAGALAGAWFDTAAPSPANATAAQLAQEAVRAAEHFDNTTAAANRYAMYVIVSPSGTHPDGFNTSGSDFCGWHDYTASASGDIAYANMPYVSDAGGSCGSNFINTGSQGQLDGFSIVSGHEYAETLTDQNPPGGWTNSNGAEVGDECAWISSGQGASANVVMGNGAYAMQGIWSNDTNECEISHAIL